MKRHCLEHGFYYNVLENSCPVCSVQASIRRKAEADWEFGLSFHLDGLHLPSKTSDSDLSSAVHKILADKFSKFEVVVEKVVRDGSGNLLNIAVGIITKKEIE